MKTLNILVFAAALSILMIGCGGKESPLAPVANEPAKLRVIPEEGEDNANEPEPKWALNVHKSMMVLAAAKMGLSSTRQNQMSYWAAKPDTVDGEGVVPGSQQWRHGYVYLSGVYVWGGAAQCLDQNIYGTSGYLNKSAGYYYSQGNKTYGDYYLGYALHYLADVGNPWHTNADIVSQATSHGNYETWVKNNWTTGWNFSADFYNESASYSYSDIRDYVRKLSKYSYNNSKSIDAAFTASGKPTGKGTGNSTLVSLTRSQMKETSKYMRGCIRKVLDQYGMW